MKINMRLLKINEVSYTTGRLFLFFSKSNVCFFLHIIFSSFLNTLKGSENIAVERHNMFSSVPSLVQVDDSLCERRSASDTVTSGQFPDMILIQPPPHIP